MVVCCPWFGLYHHPKRGFIKGLVSRFKTYRAVKKVKAGPIGRKAFEQLENSSRTHAIIVGPTPTGVNGTRQLNRSEGRVRNGENGEGTGTIIYWDPNNKTTAETGVDDNGGTTRDPSIGLGHEVGHAADFDNGSHPHSGVVKKDEFGGSCQIKLLFLSWRLNLRDESLHLSSPSFPFGCH